MRRKKSSTTPKKRANGKQKTFLSLLVVGIMAVAIGIPATLGLYQHRNSQGEVAAATTISIQVSEISLSTISKSGSNSIACPLSTSSPKFASTYSVRCWGNNAAQRTAPGATCQSANSLYTDAYTFCGSKSIPTPTRSNPWGATMSPTKAKLPTPTIRRVTPTAACPRSGTNHATYCAGNTLREKYSNGSCGMSDNLLTKCAGRCYATSSTSAKCY